VNEIVKNTLAKHNGVSPTNLSLSNKFIAGACGGLAYWLTVFPLDVIKVRYTFHHHTIDFIFCD